MQKQGNWGWVKFRTVTGVRAVDMNIGVREFPKIQHNLRVNCAQGNREEVVFILTEKPGFAQLPD